MLLNLGAKNFCYYCRFSRFYSLFGWKYCFLSWLRNYFLWTNVCV